jgi:uncharacterized pyridoxamine 5'-phosphate oxidase family protein
MSAYWMYENNIAYIVVAVLFIGIIIYSRTATGKKAYENEKHEANDQICSDNTTGTIIRINGHDYDSNNLRGL